MTRSYLGRPTYVWITVSGRSCVRGARRGKGGRRACARETARERERGRERERERARARDRQRGREREREREGERERARVHEIDSETERESARACASDKARQETDGGQRARVESRTGRARARAHTHSCTRTAPANPALMTPDPLSTTIGADMSSSCTEVQFELWASVELRSARAQSAGTGRGARAGGGQSTAAFGCRAFAPEVRLCALPLPSSSHPV